MVVKSFLSGSISLCDDATYSHYSRNICSVIFDLLWFEQVERFATSGIHLLDA